MQGLSGRIGGYAQTSAIAGDVFGSLAQQPLSALGFRFRNRFAPSRWLVASSKPSQIAAHKGRYRSVQLRSPDSRQPVRFLVHRNCDVPH